MYKPNPRYQQLNAKDSYLTQDVTTQIVPVPIGGWDAISPLAQMDPKYAPILINWVPRPGWIEIRGGYTPWCQNINTVTPVESLMVYRPPNGSDQMFAASGSGIYNVSLGVGGSLVASGFTSARWRYINYSPNGASMTLMACNGKDPMQSYNGTTWSATSITGITSSTINNIQAFKQRIWFTVNNSTSAWYLGTSAVSGTVTEFPLGPLMTKGGSLLAIGDWTIDGGTGPDDFLVFATTKGQYIVYKGTDPSNANAFALVGVFDLPVPIGAKCFQRVGSELTVITSQGLIPISQALPYDPSGARSVAFTNRIQNAMLQAAQSYSANFGWELTSFPLEGLLLLNIPQITNTTQVQFVMNNYTGAWTQFQGWNANCFVTFNENLYFGDNTGNVNLAYAGTLDKTTAIHADVQCAFNTFEDPGRIKNMTMLRPLIVAGGNPSPALAVDVDFDNTAPTATISLLTAPGAEWDVSLWDQSVWFSGLVTSNLWVSVDALGTYLAVRMIVNFGGNSSVTNGTGSVFDTGLFDTAIFDGNGGPTGSGSNIPTVQINAFEAIMQSGGPI